MIDIKGLIHKYDVWLNHEEKSQYTALNDVSLTIEPGEFVVILGANGSGKSTLAKHLNVLLLPNEGGVWIDGKDTKDKEKLSAIRSSVGMVFQNPDNQIIGTSVEEDVAFGPENRNEPSEQIRKKVSESLKIVNLESKRKVSPIKLSGGQKQKVAIAGLLADEPKYIVLDEPTAMLDPESRKEVLEVVHKLNKENGITIILITHNTDEAVDADNIILMNKGKILKQGTPQEIFRNVELLHEVKMNIPPVTELGNRLKKDGLPIKTPILNENELVEELKMIYTKRIKQNAKR